MHCRDIAVKEITLAAGLGAAGRGGTMTGIVWFAVAVIWLVIAAYAYPS